MGLHNEFANARCSPFDAEMRRRLWWALTLFDAHVGKLADYRTFYLTSLWDCKLPLNVDDVDVRDGMKEPPVTHGRATEAIFAVVRCVIADFLRHAPFHVNFTNPSLGALGKDHRNGGDIDALEKLLEDQYLRHCDPGVPLQYMTLWMARGHLAKMRLLKRYWMYGPPSSGQAEAQRHVSMLLAVEMLDCDTKLVASPLVKTYLWFIQLHFPLSAYLHLVQIMRSSPLDKLAQRAWKAMNENYEARFNPQHGWHKLTSHPTFSVFTRIILLAGDALEATLQKAGESYNPPAIITSILQHRAQKTETVIANEATRAGDTMSVEINDFLASMDSGFPMLDSGLIEGSMQGDHTSASPAAYNGFHTTTAATENVNEGECARANSNGQHRISHGWPDW